MPKLALRAAASLAHAGAELTLLYIADVAGEFRDGAYSLISNDELELHDARVKQQIGNALAILSEYGATATAWTIQGRPVHESINQIAKAIKADSILMGTHGRRGISRLWHGSVTERVVREADLPVIVIRESSRRPFFPLFLERQELR